MLQQTTVATVGPYFEKFLKAWPTVQEMALAPLDDILTAWAGLGYYARARNLHKCAKAVSEDFGGVFPPQRDTLMSLPGIGPYTAAAISAIAFDQPETVVDGNIERIMARLFRVPDAMPTAKKAITDYAETLTPRTRAGDYAQALMDIGATVCTPRNPNCAICPVADFCAAYLSGDMETYPVKAPRKIKPTRRAVVFWLENMNGEVLLRRREEKGLLGGMMEFPSTDWQPEEISAEDAAAGFFAQSGLAMKCVPKGTVRHTFTHFHLELRPVVSVIAEPEKLSLSEAIWVRPENFDDYALPTLMLKVAKAVMGS